MNGFILVDATPQKPSVFIEFIFLTVLEKNLRYHTVVRIAIVRELCLSRLEPRLGMTLHDNTHKYVNWTSIFF